MEVRLRHFPFLSKFKDLVLLAAFLTQTVTLDDATVKFEIWDTAGQGNSLLGTIQMYPNHEKLF